jgi:hypothetical protein
VQNSTVAYNIENPVEKLCYVGGKYLDTAVPTRRAQFDISHQENDLIINMGER